MARKAFYSSAPCGAGKTFQLAEKARQAIRRGSNVLIVQPTKLLADETAENEFRNRPRCPAISVFHGGTVGTAVGRQLAEFLAEPKNEPQVVIATHQALPRLTHRVNLHYWDLMIDECPQVEGCKTHSFLHTHTFLTDAIKVVPVDDVYGQVVVQDYEALKAIARNKDKDELWAKLQETAGVILNPHWSTFVNLDQYQRLLEGAGRELTFHSILEPTVVSGFRSVFVTAANLEESAAYQLWGRRGIKWKQDEKFIKALRYDIHPNGRSATIYYGVDQDWSSVQCDHLVDGVPCDYPSKIIVE